MNQWLYEFAYRIDIDANVYIISGAAITLMALFTVGYQAINAALQDPVKSLRAE